MDIGLTEKLINFFNSYKKIEFPQNELIVHGNDEPTGVYFVVKGYVKMSAILEDGTEIAINIFKPGTFLPMIWAIGNIENTYYFRSLTNVVTYKAPKEKFLEFLKENPDVLFDLTSRILVGLDGILFTTRYMLHANSLKKTAIMMLTLCRRFGTLKENGEIEISIQMTHQDLAHFAGTSRETVSLAIEKLKSKGIVYQKDRKFIVKDVKALELI